MASSLGPNISESGLVLCLDAADKNSYPGSGTTWTDLSGNANNGTLTNGPTFSGTNSGVIIFDGTDDYVTVTNNATLRLNDITVEAWIYIAANPSDWVRICGVGSANGTVNNRMYGLWYNGTNASANRNLLWQRYGATDPGIYATSVTLSLNTWYQVVATTTGSSHVLYLNASSIGTATAAGPWPTNTSDNITICYAGFHTYHNGRIGLVRIYNRGITASEVLQNYNATKSRFGL